MLKILLLEDEEPAAARLIKMIKEIEPAVEILDSIVSVSSAVKWFETHNQPDLIFSDIQLADGSSFEIFKQVHISCPVIFTTAFDQYAIDAFKLNSVDYLLKPVKKTELETAIDKFKKLHHNQQAPVLDIQKLMDSYNVKSDTFKKRFVVRYGDHIKTINTTDIAYFFTEDKANFLTTFEGRRFAIDFNLDNLESMIDPSHFFRINRQFIVAITSIEEMLSYSKGRVLIKLKPVTRHETIVSTERSADFKAWLGDNK